MSRPWGASDGPLIEPIGAEGVMTPGAGSLVKLEGARAVTTSWQMVGISKSEGGKHWFPMELGSEEHSLPSLSWRQSEMRVSVFERNGAELCSGKWQVWPSWWRREE